MLEPIDRQINRLKVAPFITKILANASRERQFHDGSKGERLRHYLANNGLEPRQTIIVGDSPEETYIARSLGLISVAITGGFVSEQLPAILHERGFTA